MRFNNAAVTSMIRRSKTLRRFSSLHFLTKSEAQKQRRARTVESEIRELLNSGSANEQPL